MSGGIDSTTLLAQLVNAGKEVVGIMFDYGQENLEPTLASAKHYASQYAVTDFRLIKIPYDWSKASIIKGNYIDEGISNDNVYAKDVKALSWVPARNATMLLIAGGIASEIGVKKVYCSFQFDRSEWEAYKALKRKSQFAAADLTPRFLLYLNKITDFCYKSKVRFHAPYIEQELDCIDIVQQGRSIGVDYSHTYSCRYYKDGAPCGVCEQCIIRERRLA